MKPDSNLARQLKGNGSIVTVEYQPHPTAITTDIEQFAQALGNSAITVNVADNQNGVALSSLAAAVALLRCGQEPLLQMVTRDRNRIALQSDLLGAASLGIKNVLCLSGYHQKLIGNSKSANVFDIDSIQLISMVKEMNEGHLLDGTQINGDFSLLIGAVINPGLKPLELNLIRLEKKINAGAEFIQTQAVFDVASFQKWINAVNTAGLAGRTGIIASVLALSGADEAKRLNETHTDYVIPKVIIERLAAAGNAEAQKKEGLVICAETAKQLNNMKGLRGLHILSGGNNAFIGEIIRAII